MFAPFLILGKVGLRLCEVSTSQLLLLGFMQVCLQVMLLVYVLDSRQAFGV